MLDPALTRPGRLSRRVAVPLPDEAARGAILGVHMRGTPLTPGVERAGVCAALARVTGGLSGAELANVVNEAALLAGRRGAEARPRAAVGQSCVSACQERAVERGARGAASWHGGALAWHERARKRVRLRGSARARRPSA